MLRIEVIESEFLARLADQCFLNLFAIADMAANCSIPVAREEVLLETAALEIYLTETVHDMEMYYRMQRFRTRVAVFSGRLAIHHAVLVEDREHLSGTVAGSSPEDRGRAGWIDEAYHANS